jgi:hypothetical protein
MKLGILITIVIVLGAIATSEGSEEIKFEDSHFIKLKEIVSKFKWSFLSKEIVEFGDYIESIK